MKAPTLILKENSRAIATAEHKEPKVNYLLLWNTTNVYTVYNKKSSLCVNCMYCVTCLGSQYSMLVIHCTILIQNTQECETFLCVECTKPD